MGVDIGTLSGRIELKDAYSGVLDSVSSHIQQATAALSKFAGVDVAGPLDSITSALTSATGEAALAAAGFGAVTFAAYELSTAAAEIGSHLVDLSYKMGTTVEETGAMDFMAKALGSSADALSNSIFMMSRRVAQGSAQMKAGIAELGLSWADWSKQKPEEQLLEISDAMRALPSNVNKSNIAFEIFGRMGREMLSKLMEPMRDLTTEGESFNTWTTASAQAAKDFTITVNILHEWLSKLWTTVGRDLLPTFKAWVEELKASGALEKVVDVAHAVADAFKVVLGAITVVIDVVRAAWAVWDAQPTVLKRVEEGALGLVAAVKILNSTLLRTIALNLANWAMAAIGPLTALIGLLTTEGLAGVAARIGVWASTLAVTMTPTVGVGAVAVEGAAVVDAAVAAGVGVVDAAAVTAVGEVDAATVDAVIDLDSATGVSVADLGTVTVAGVADVSAASTAAVVDVSATAAAGAAEIVTGGVTAVAGIATEGEVVEGAISAAGMAGMVEVGTSTIAGIAAVAAATVKGIAAVRAAGLLTAGEGVVAGGVVGSVVGGAAAGAGMKLLGAGAETAAIDAEVLAPGVVAADAAVQTITIDATAAGTALTTLGADAAGVGTTMAVVAPPVIAAGEAAGAAGAAATAATSGWYIMGAGIGRLVTALVGGTGSLEVAAGVAGLGLTGLVEWLALGGTEIGHFTDQISNSLNPAAALADRLSHLNASSMEYAQTLLGSETSLRDFKAGLVDLENTPSVDLAKLFEGKDTAARLKAMQLMIAGIRTDADKLAALGLLQTAATASPGPTAAVKENIVTWLQTIELPAKQLAEYDTQMAKYTDDVKANLADLFKAHKDLFDRLTQTDKWPTGAITLYTEKMKAQEEQEKKSAEAIKKTAEEAKKQHDALMEAADDYDRLMSAQDAQIKAWEKSPSISIGGTEDLAAMFGITPDAITMVENMVNRGGKDIAQAVANMLRGTMSTEEYDAFKKRLALFNDAYSLHVGAMTEETKKLEEEAKKQLEADNALLNEADGMIKAANDAVTASMSKQDTAIKAAQDKFTAGMQTVMSLSLKFPGKADELLAALIAERTHAISVATGGYDTIVEQMRNAGVLTVAEQQQAIDLLKQQWLDMVRWNQDPNHQLEMFDQADVDAQLRKWQDAVNKAAGIQTWSETFKQVGGMLSTTFSNINSKFGQIAQIVGNGIQKIETGFDNIRDAGTKAAAQVSEAFMTLSGVFGQLGGKLGNFLSELFGIVAAVDTLFAKLQSGQGLLGGLGSKLGLGSNNPISNYVDNAVKSVEKQILGGLSVFEGATAPSFMGAEGIGLSSASYGGLDMTALGPAGAGLGGSGTATAGVTAAGLGGAFAVGGGLAVGVGLVMGLIGSLSDAEEKAMSAAMQQIKDYSTQLTATYGSMQNLHDLAPIVGIDLSMEPAFTQGAPNLETLQKNLTQLAADIQTVSDKMTALTNLTQTYGITLQDLGPIVQKYDINQRTTTLATAFSTITATFPDQTAGENAAVKILADQVNALIYDAVKAGQKIPAALQYIADKMVTLGLITQQTAAELLGLGDDTMPSLQDITDAANRYGLALDQLGKKVGQLSLTTQADQIVTDFNTLTAAGADFSSLMNDVVTQTTDAAGNVVGVLGGMHGQIQTLVQDAMQYGLELPATLKPIIDQMIAAGKLTDASGKAIDISQLVFAPDLTASNDALIAALDKLTDALNTSGASGIPEWNVPGTGDTGGGGVPGGPGSGGQTHPMAQGSGGFRNYGLGTAAVLHGLEAVVRPVDLSALVAQSMAASNLSAAMETGSMNEVLDANRAAVASSMRVNTTAPHVAPISVSVPPMDYASREERPLYATLVTKLNNRVVAQEQIRVTPSELKRAGYVPK